MKLERLNDKKTTWVYRVIRWLVWLFSPKYQLEGTENLPDEPCVIVGNHSHMYGPIEGELYTPGKHYVWCAGEMMNREEHLWPSVCSTTPIRSQSTMIHA